MQERLGLLTFGRMNFYGHLFFVQIYFLQNFIPMNITHKIIHKHLQPGTSQYQKIAQLLSPQYIQYFIFKWVV